MLRRWAREGRCFHQVFDVSVLGTLNATGRMAEASIPIGRVAQSAEIAEWVWLLTGGGASSFMTGETITLSGGDVIR